MDLYVLVSVNMISACVNIHAKMNMYVSAITKRKFGDLYMQQIWHLTCLFPQVVIFVFCP
jgi:hypothetical protein